MFHWALNFENDSQYLSTAFRVKGEWSEKIRVRRKNLGIRLNR
ncbi:hypothetical protein LEP1GSC036_0609 [Leptospira weilii str. 2006001853]|uniref:Uncharacterized protein n=3 Tax=Leptospira weilii TaxID=28184 RepID=A0A828Z163_9LEPT|nr:hypothetical protein LEP1GSC036_0609 [Leptospira weilii str. 2006001853]EMJ64595.1 hypothetical protein LEP1GSC051_2810 [Leptospira sp. P2653]EMM74413.1 hypothetical protein LEP1GSC038_2451 [Leptospira weilii str. 2006001855]EMN42994.1 hypothetical protein LEP1GSC086_1762 [Leptospira weilii str. LNT 1234]EMN87953.1 hypothetical protein LEP1GSC108_0902 [Leptospira weilii str. UI 13098]